MSFLQKLDKLPAFHHVVRWLGLRQLAGLVLRLFPRVRSLPNTGARYRCRYLETILLADEIFHRNVYLKAIDQAQVTNFADLGCNVGLFAVLLADLTRRRDLQGLMVDANPDMIAEAQWHVTTNGLARVFPVHGLAGAEKIGGQSDFYLLPSNLGSSQYPIYEPGKPPKGKWTKVTVPQISLEEHWQRHFGEQRCHVLKIDIEGSEKKLLDTDRPFLRRVDTLILEWHKWIVSRQEIDALLEPQGFSLVEILEELETSGIAWYQRRTPPSATSTPNHRSP
jgi:FkbM family methyltransferase